MNEAATSLDRLHDIVLPAEVAWWPLAPGWYVVGGSLLLVVMVLVYRSRKRWLANAYRRAALHELAAIDDAAGIAELLRRTALASTSRAVIAAKTGAAWLDWLESQCPQTMPETVRRQLTIGVYTRRVEADELDELRDYAACWIRRHQLTEHQVAGHQTSGQPPAAHQSLAGNGIPENGKRSEPY
jgi:hypothetical protein